MKFKRRVNSIPLIQFGHTYNFDRKNRVRIQNLEQRLVVRGLEQVPEGAEFASANLEKRGDDYFMHIVTYQVRSTGHFRQGCLGIDFGVDKQLTLSNGLAVREGVADSKRLPRLHRELSRRKRDGANYRKTLKKINSEYEWTVNQRKDIANKISGRLTSKYETISVQDDPIKGWMRIWGRKLQAATIGRLRKAIQKRAQSIVIVPKFRVTTGKCSHCKHAQKTTLGERTFRCLNCGLTIDRDLNAAINIWKEIPMEHREVKPVDTKAATELREYFNNIPNVSACLVDEAGSLYRKREQLTGTIPCSESRHGRRHDGIPNTSASLVGEAGSPRVVHKETA